jgi:hypothetical protein
MKHIPYSLYLVTILLLAGRILYGATPAGEPENAGTLKLLAQRDSITQLLKQDSATKKANPRFLVYPKITGIGSLAKSRPANYAVFNDYIYLKVDSLRALKALTDSITGGKKDTMGDLILYINGNAMRDLALLNIDQGKGELIFQLDRHSNYLMKFYPEFQYMWSTLPVSVTAGYRNGLMIPADPAMKSLDLVYVSKYSIVFSLLFVLSIMASFVILAMKTNLIRTGDDNSPFSLALTQLSFWTIVIGSSFIYIWIVTDEIPPITGSTLILLSVSALTTAGSRLVDIRGKLKVGTMPKSISFMEDILQDELGYSVHRAQMFMWTVIMGVIFVANVIRFQEIPQLDESLLALMGISSGAYVGLKTMENKSDGAGNTTDKPEGDQADGRTSEQVNG